MTFITVGHAVVLPLNYYKPVLGDFHKEIVVKDNIFKKHL